MKAALSKLLVVCVAIFIAALTCGVSGPAGKAGVLIIQDEKPQMDVLAKFLEEKGKGTVGQAPPYVTIVAKSHWITIKGQGPAGTIPLASLPAAGAALLRRC